MGIVDNTAPGGGGPDRAGGRSVALDAARGLAVAAMVVYHTAWDLSSLSLIETDVTASPGWSWFARTVAAGFLVLAGIGLVLAHGRGTRWRPFARRLAVLAAAALAITAVTRIVFPDSYIFFGILHNMALSSLVALPFVRAPAAVTVLVAALLLAAPLLLASPALNAPLLAFLGLGTVVSDTNDYVPLLPWTGFVFAGLALGRLAAGRLAGPGREPARPWRVLGAVGRRSLLIYLVHQPLIFGALSAVQAVIGPNEAAEAAPFLARCEGSCVGSGQGAAFCRSTCQCTVGALRRDGLWAPVLTGSLTPGQSARAAALAQECVRPVQ